jgi:hypothetical protein
VRTGDAGYIVCVSGVTEQRKFDVECPHCHKPFAGEPIEGGRAARYLGFKCPHCKLFVPLERATDDEPLEPSSRETDATS